MSYLPEVDHYKYKDAQASCHIEQFLKIFRYGSCATSLVTLVYLQVLLAAPDKYLLRLKTTVVQISIRKCELMV